MATLAQQRLAVPVTKTAMSMTDARRQLAAKPRSYGLAPQPGVMQPPTPQMRNSAGQMGPAVGLAGDANQLDRQKVGMAGQRQQPQQMYDDLIKRGWTPEQAKARAGMQRVGPQGQPQGVHPAEAFARHQELQQDQIMQRRKLDLQLDQQRQQQQKTLFQQQMAQQQQQGQMGQDYANYSRTDLMQQPMQPAPQAQQQGPQFSNRMYDDLIKRGWTPEQAKARASMVRPQLLPQAGFDQQQRQQDMQRQQMMLDAQMRQQDTAPAMLTPGEAVIPFQQTQFLRQQGMLDNALGVSQQQLDYDTALRQQQAQFAAQRFAMGGIVPFPQGYATGGIVPTTGITATAPTMAVARPVTGVQPGLTRPTSLPPQPVTGPVTPGPQPTPQPYRTDWGGLRQEIGAFGAAPTLDDSTMARMRAIESQKLGNLYRGQLSELGASAASSGAGLYGGDLAGIAAGFAAQRGQQESELGLKYNVAALDQKREDFYKQFGAAQSLAMQRESQGFTADEAALDRKWRSGEALSDREWKTLEAARDRTQQTSERLGSQGFTADESQKQRVLITDENAKDRLSQMALAEKNIEAQKANLESQLAQARSENNLDRVQQLTVQKNELDQQDQSLRQQNDQYLTDFGLRRDVFERGKTEFDLTRTDQIGQFADNLDLQNRQLTESGRVANMDDATVRYVADLKDRLERDINAAVIDPSNLQTLLSTIGTIAQIPGLGELVFGQGGLVREGLDKLFGGSDATTSELDKLKGAAGAGDATSWWRDSSGGLSTPVQAAVGAAAAYALFDTFNDPKGFSRTAQAVASGAALGSVLPGIGTAVGAIGGAIVGGLSSAFGPGARQVSQAEFTTQFDEMYRRLQSGGALTQDASNPESLIQPQNRLGLALSFKQAWEEYAKAGTGNIEVSGPDITRMQQLGLVAQVGGGGGAAKAFLIDDPRVIALAGGGDISKYLDIQTTDKMVDRTHEATGGSLAQLIAGGTVVLKDKTTGEVVDLNNAEQLRQIAQRNLGGTPVPSTAAPTTTPPKQAVA